MRCALEPTRLENSPTAMMHGWMPVPRVLAWAFGVLACSSAEANAPPGTGGEPNTPLVYSPRSDCESALGSDRPCPGLLSPCPNVPPPQPGYINTLGVSTCAGEHLRGAGTVENAMPLIVVRMDDECAVQVEFEVVPERFPAGLGLGDPVDVEVFQANGDTARDPQLWLILRSPITGELLFTIHQNPWQLLESGVARDVLGFDVAIAEPTCEVFRRNSSVLYHRYGLRVQTGQTTTVLEDVYAV